MTGEMVDVNLDNWPFHKAIAEELGGTVEPFDRYQGPYVLIGGDVRIGESPYAIAPSNMGVTRLWLSNGNGLPYVYREDTEEQSDTFIPFLDGEPNTEGAVAQALSLFDEEELDTTEEI